MFDNLINKLPTSKEIAAFFYVSTHWSTISEDLQRYHNQIEDEWQWRSKNKDQLEKLCELEKQKLAREPEQKLENAATVTPDLFESWVAAVAQLTIYYHLHPLEWELERHTMNPRLRESIHDGMACLPPAPPAVSNVTMQLIRNIFGSPPPGTSAN